MSQLKTNAIRHITATSDAITLASDGTATAKITNNLSNRNLIINGAMQVNQYGTSSTTSASRVCDRFRVNWGGADEAFTYSKHALTSSDTGPWAKGFRHSLHVQNGNQTSGAGAADYGGINYRVEAQDVVTSGWDSTSASSYITFSYWVKSSVAQNFYVRVYINDAPQYSYAFETGALSANTWTKITKTIPGNPNIAIVNDNGNGLEFDMNVFLGTDYTGSMSLNNWAADNGALRTPDQTSTWWTTNDATFEITGVQLEVGEVATEFEHRTYQDEFLRCCRYYQQIGGHAQFSGRGSSNTEMSFTVPLVVPLRASPTVSKTNSYYRGYDPSSAGNSSNTPTVMTWNADHNYLALVLDGFSSSAGVEDDKCATLQQWNDGVTKLSAEL